MTRLQAWASHQPDKPAVILPDSGQSLSYAQLDRRSGRVARWLVSMGLEAGDGILILMENRAEIIELAWAARRAGLYYTTVSTHLKPPEIAHIVKDSGARLLFVSASTADLAASLRAWDDADVLQTFIVSGEDGRFSSYEQAVMGVDATYDLPVRPIGRDMLYSSGTTGLPKGIRRPLVLWEDRDKPDPEIEAWKRNFAFDEQAVYLSTAPLYHAAPLRYIMRTLEIGGTCVVMEKFDPERSLAAIERFRVTHTQWVPTMFVRLLRLPHEVRARYDLSSMHMAIHSAAPCPVHVKQALLDWWGDVVFEYYAGSEGVGATVIGPLEWRRFPGSVGRAMAGRIHIVDDDGQELQANDIGKIYFSGIASFRYLNDPEKTRSAYNDRGWATYGDIGYVNEEGYLFLVDRRADLILSGGVNIYPQEIENTLGKHPAVEDVAVIGVPDDEFGQVAKAVVHLRQPHLAGPAMAQELIAFCEPLLSRLKLPKSIVFDAPLPRLETGKLLRRVLKERYQAEPQAGYCVQPVNQHSAMASAN